MCLCSWPTWRHGKWGYLSFILYLSKKYLATVHSTVCPFSSCNGKLQIFKNYHLIIHFHTNTYDCICAGLLVTLHTLYFLLIAPQWVISIFNPLISLVNLTRWLSVNGFLCSLMSLISSTSHINSITGCAL